MAVWRTSSGAAEDGVRATSGALLCCDLSHDEVPLLVTLETDGEIRLYGLCQGQWRRVAQVTTALPGVEVKLERRLLLAVGHAEDGLTGAVHAWEVQRTPEGWRLGEEAVQVQERPPDRVEPRHGGRFIEVFFLTEQRVPDGVYDIEWYEYRNRRLRRVLEVQGGIGDWRCDLRDVVARLEGDTVCWLPLFEPLAPGKVTFMSSEWARNLG